MASTCSGRRKRRVATTSGSRRTPAWTRGPGSSSTTRPSCSSGPTRSASEWCTWIARGPARASPGSRRSTSCSRCSVEWGSAGAGEAGPGRTKALALRSARRGCEGALDRGAELLEVERLLEHGDVEPRELLAGRLEGRGRGGADDHGDPARRRVEGEDLELLPAGGVAMQEEIEDHQVGVRVLDVAERVGRRLDVVAVALQRDGDDGARVVIVLDDDDALPFQGRVGSGVRVGSPPRGGSLARVGSAVRAGTARVGSGVRKRSGVLEGRSLSASWRARSSPCCASSGAVFSSSSRTASCFWRAASTTSFASVRLSSLVPGFPRSSSTAAVNRATAAAYSAVAVGAASGREVSARVSSARR